MAKDNLFKDLSENIKIHSTMNYAKFSLLRCNRPIMKTHVERIANEMIRRDLTKENPIKVNTDYEVMDGQHRLEACNQLNIPVYYQFTEMEPIDIGLFNSMSEKWNYEQYLHYWIEHDVEDYKILGQYRRRYPYAISAFIHLLTGDYGKRLYDDFKNGTFVITQSLASIEEILRKITQLKEFNDSIYRTKSFMMTYAYDVLTHPDFDHDKFLKKLALVPTKFIRQTKKKDYLRMIEDIYNRNVSEPNYIRFY